METPAGHAEEAVGGAALPLSSLVKGRPTPVTVDLLGQTRGTAGRPATTLILFVFEAFFVGKMLIYSHPNASFFELAVFWIPTK